MPHGITRSIVSCLDTCNLPFEMMRSMLFLASILSWGSQFLLGRLGRLLGDVVISQGGVGTCSNISSSLTSLTCLHSTSHRAWATTDKIKGKERAGGVEIKAWITLSISFVLLACNYIDLYNISSIQRSVLYTSTLLYTSMSTYIWLNCKTFRSLPADNPNVEK